MIEEQLKAILERHGAGLSATAAQAKRLMGTPPCANADDVADLVQEVRRLTAHCGDLEAHIVKSEGVQEGGGFRAPWVPVGVLDLARTNEVASRILKQAGAEHWSTLATLEWLTCGLAEAHNEAKNQLIRVISEGAPTILVQGPVEEGVPIFYRARGDTDP